MIPLSSTVSYAFGCSFCNLIDGLEWRAPGLSVARFTSDPPTSFKEMHCIYMYIYTDIYNYIAGISWQLIGLVPFRHASLEHLTRLLLYFSRKPTHHSQEREGQGPLALVVICCPYRQEHVCDECHGRKWATLSHWKACSDLAQCYASSCLGTRVFLKKPT